MEVHKIKKAEEVMIVLVDSNMQLVHPVNQYLKYLTIRGRAENTLLSYAKDLKTYFSFLEQSGFNYRQVDAQTIQSYMEHLRLPSNMAGSIYAESMRSASTVNRMIGTVYQFYCYQSLVGNLNNPLIMGTSTTPPIFREMLYHTRKSTRAKQSIFTVKKPTYQIHLLTPPEIERMDHALPSRRDRLIFKVLVQSGARISEVLSLKISDIPIPDVSEPITILHGIQSKGKRRDIYIPTSLAIELDDYILEHRTRIDVMHGYLFTAQHPHQNHRPISYRGIYEVFKRAGKKVGLNFKFHDTRHTFITNLVESGMDFSVVRILAGHNHVTTTQKYATLSTGYIASALQEYWKTLGYGEDKQYE